MEHTRISSDQMEGDSDPDKRAAGLQASQKLKSHYKRVWDNPLAEVDRAEADKGSTDYQLTLHSTAADSCTSVTPQTRATGFVVKYLKTTPLVDPATAEQRGLIGSAGLGKDQHCVVQVNFACKPCFQHGRICLIDINCETSKCLACTNLGGGPACALMRLNPAQDVMQMDVGILGWEFQQNS